MFHPKKHGGLTTTSESPPGDQTFWCRKCDKKHWHTIHGKWERLQGNGEYRYLLRNLGRKQAPTNWSQSYFCSQEKETSPQKHECLQLPSKRKNVWLKKSSKNQTAGFMIQHGTHWSVCSIHWTNECFKWKRRGEGNGVKSTILSDICRKQWIFFFLPFVHKPVFEIICFHQLK